MPLKHSKRKIKKFLRNIISGVNFNDQSSRFALALILIVALLFISSLAQKFAGQKSKQPAVKKVETIKEPVRANPGERQTGIVTFFHTAPMTGQLEIFSDWEGRYRTVQSGNKFSLLFLDKNGQHPEIFSIEYMNAKDWDKVKRSAKFMNSQEIKREGHLAFIMHRGSSDSLTDQKEVASLQAMKQDVDIIIKNFRVFPAR